MAAWPYSTAAWQRLRQAKLSAQPMCEVCLLRGRSVLAEAVDHIKAIKSGGDPFPALDGLMSMCTTCHSVKTNRQDRAGGKGGLAKGCGVDGGPIDPGDGWYTTGPGAFAGRPTDALGPAAGTSVDLVLHNNDGELPWV